MNAHFYAHKHHSGYIGGSVMLRFLNHSNSAYFQITALTRTREKWDALKSMGVNAVWGSLSNLQLLEGLAQEADFIIQTVRPC